MTSEEVKKSHSDRSTDERQEEKDPSPHTTPTVEPTSATREDVIEALKRVEDPELFLDVWFLGLIYSINFEGAKVLIDMTFTSPMCPAGPSLIADVKKEVGTIAGVEEVEVQVVFTPPWEPPDEVQGLLGFY